MITDPEVREFIEKTNFDLCEEDQESHVIDLIVTKTIRFFESHMYLLENLLRTLRDEQMFDAVLHIANEMLQIGKKRKNNRFMAFSSFIIGELLTQEFSSDPDQLMYAKANLTEAFDAYSLSSNVLTDDEYSRLCMSLSTLYRIMGDASYSKRFLELARDKTTDKNLLLQFYRESAVQLA